LGRKMTKCVGKKNTEWMWACWEVKLSWVELRCFCFDCAAMFGLENREEQSLISLYKVFYFSLAACDLMFFFWVVLVKRKKNKCCSRIKNGVMLKLKLFFFDMLKFYHPVFWALVCLSCCFNPNLVKWVKLGNPSSQAFQDLILMTTLWFNEEYEVRKIQNSWCEIHVRTNLGVKTTILVPSFFIPVSIMFNVTFWLHPQSWQN
jgi:hypothetical protein